MGASEIGVEELLSKKMSKNNLDCSGTSEKKNLLQSYNLKNMAKIEHWNYF